MTPNLDRILSRHFLLLETPRNSPYFESSPPRNLLFAESAPLLAINTAIDEHNNVHGMTASKKSKGGRRQQNVASS